MSLGQIVITSCEFRCFFCETHRFRRWEPNPLCRSLVPGALGHPSCPVVAKETIEAHQCGFCFSARFIHFCFRILFDVFIHVVSLCFTNFMSRNRNIMFHNVSWCPSISSQDLCSSIPCEGCLYLSSQLALPVPNEFGWASPHASNRHKNHSKLSFERRKHSSSSTIQKTNTTGWKFAGFPKHFFQHLHGPCEKSLIEIPGT